MKIKVGVVGENASGAPDVLFVEVECAQADVDSGEHYDRAKRLAAERGYEPRVAFDSTDPLWRTLSPKSDRFFERFAVELQGCWAPGEEVSGADAVDQVCELFWSELKQRKTAVSIVFGPGAHYLAQEVDAAGTISTYHSDSPGFIFDQDLVRQHVEQGATAVEIPMKALRQMTEALPGVEEMHSAFERVARNAKEEGILAEMQNPGALLKAYVEEEVADLDNWFAPILSASWTAWRETQPLADVIVARHWGHCFVGSKESITRWAYGRADEAMLSAQVDEGGGRWRDLSASEIVDVLQGLKDNDILDMGDAALVAEWGFEVMTREEYDAEASPNDANQTPRQRG